MTVCLFLLDVFRRHVGIECRVNERPRKAISTFQLRLYDLVYSRCVYVASDRVQLLGIEKTCFYFPGDHSVMLSGAKKMKKPV